MTRHWWMVATLAGLTIAAFVLEMSPTKWVLAATLAASLIWPKKHRHFFDPW